jgi:hypothetical protein
MQQTIIIFWTYHILPSMATPLECMHMVEVARGVVANRGLNAPGSHLWAADDVANPPLAPDASVMHLSCIAKMQLS